MNDLVFVKKNNVFTTSWIIHEGTGFEHATIQKKIRDFSTSFEKLGNICFTDVTSVKSKAAKRGRPARIYDLNEPQAAFLLTLLENNEKVVQFKLELVQEFYRMKQFILEQGVANKYKEWKLARSEGKQTRIGETDAIRDYLIPLVEAQNPDSSYLSNPDRVYQNYTKLVNSILGISSKQRDKISSRYLLTINMMEHAIKNVIQEEAEKGTAYKEIYKLCKQVCQQIKKVSFLEEEQKRIG
jgi:phage regulator Rha-like protein